jgi:hypothetical protein
VKAAHEDDIDGISDTSSSGYEEMSGDEALNLNLKGREKAKPDWNLTRRNDIAKRSNKHA